MEFSEVQCQQLTRWRKSRRWSATCATLRIGATDLSWLDADERTEMMDAMHAAEVALGDQHRFRLRLN